jgi:hypothetical protein
MKIVTTARCSHPLRAGNQRLFPEGHLHLHAAGSGGVDRGGNVSNNELYHWPLGMAKHNERNGAGGEVLLMLNVLVGRHQYLKACSLSNLNQISVGELFPSPRAGFLDCVPFKKTRKATRGAVVEKNKQNVYP